MKLFVAILFAAVLFQGSEQAQISGGEASSTDLDNSEDKAFDGNINSDIAAGGCFVSGGGASESLKVFFNPTRVDKVKVTIGNGEQENMKKAQIFTCLGAVCTPCSSQIRDMPSGGTAAKACGGIEADSVQIKSGAGRLSVCEIFVEDSPFATESPVFSPEYFFSSTHRNWFDARSDCVSRGGSLVSPQSSAEVFELKTLSGLNMFWTSWNDLEDEGVFRDAQGRYAFGLPALWRPGQPDNFLGGEDCGDLIVFLDGVSGFNDDNCNFGKPYICVDNLPEDRQDDEYYWSPQKKNFRDAEADCVSRGGKLLSEPTHAALNALNVKFWSEFWTGWRENLNNGEWSDGQGNLLATTDEIWAPGQPDNWGGYENCGNMFTFPWTFWFGFNDAPCDWVEYFICDLRSE